MKTRIEKDLLGEVELPADAPYGIHGAPALKNSPSQEPPFPLGAKFGVFAEAFSRDRRRAFTCVERTRSPRSLMALGYRA